MDAEGITVDIYSILGKFILWNPSKIPHQSFEILTPKALYGLLTVTYISKYKKSIFNSSQNSSSCNDI